MSVKPHQPVFQARHPLNLGIYSAWMMGGVGDNERDATGRKRIASATNTTTARSPWGPALSQAADGHVVSEAMRALGAQLHHGWTTVTLLRSSNTTDTMALYSSLNDGFTMFCRVDLNNFNGTAPGRLFLTLRDDDADSDTKGCDFDTGVTDGDWHLLVTEQGGGGCRIWLDRVEQTVTDFQDDAPSSFSAFEYDFAVTARNNRGTIASPFIGDVAFAAVCIGKHGEAWARAADPFAGLRPTGSIIPMLAGGAVDEVRPVCVSVDGRARLGVGVDGQPRLSGEVAGKTRLNVTVKGIICR